VQICVVFAQPAKDQPFFPMLLFLVCSGDQNVLGSVADPKLLISDPTFQSISDPDPDLTFR